MKKSILLCISLAFCLVSCGESKTVLTAKFGDTVPSEIRVSLKELDTLVNVTDGKFSLEVPVERLDLGTLRCELGGLNFVSDGTKLTFDFTQAPPKVYSDSKSSLNDEFYRFDNQAMEFQMDVRNAISQIRADSSIPYAIKDSLEQQRYEELFADFAKLCKQRIASHSDDVIALLGLQVLLGSEEDEEIEAIIGKLGAKATETEFVQGIKKSLESKKKTGVGAMFTDFEVDGVKFSDFIGKGKYVLVDFWASWCGPCRREMPFLKAAWEKYKGDKFNLLSVAVWDKPEDTAKAADELGIVWSRIDNTQQIATDIYGIEGIPQIMLFGPDGVILKKDLRGGAIDAELSKYLR